MKYQIEKLANGKSGTGKSWVLCKVKLGEISYVGFADDALASDLLDEESITVDNISIEIGKTVRIGVD